MRIDAIETALVQGKGDIVKFVIESLKNDKKTFEKSFLGDVLEGAVVIVSAKIVSILEGNMVNLDDISFEELVKREAEEVIGGVEGCALTKKHGIVIPNAGVDRSNVPEGHTITWPKDPQGTADALYEGLKKEFDVENVGIIISDSRITPGRRGTTGIALAWAGFEGVQDERGKEDLFGDTLKLAQKATADNLVSAALVIMGEADECTPIAIVQEAPVVFTSRSIDMNEGVMDPKEDLFN